MSNRLVIKDELVSQASAGAQEAKNYLDSASDFASQLAAAVGTAGRLNRVIEKEEGDWRIQRKKMSDSIGNLVELVNKANQAFEDLDERNPFPEGPKPQVPVPADPNPTPSPAPPGGGGGGATPPLGGGSSGGGGSWGGSGSSPSVAPLPETPPVLTEPDAPPANRPDDPEPPADVVSDPERDRQMGQLVFLFAQRWAELTGQPVTKILAVMGALLATGALASLLAAAGGNAKTLEQLISLGSGELDGPGGDGNAPHGPGAAADIGDPSDVDDGGAAGGEPAEGEDPGLGEAPEPDEPTEPTDADPELPELGGDEDVLPPDPVGELDADPQAEATPALEPLDLGELAVSDSGSGSGGGGGGLDLPPLDAAPLTEDGGASFEPLPDLVGSVTDSSATGVGELPELSGGGEVEAEANVDLPDLESSEDRSTGRMGAPMMMGGMGAAMGGAGGSGSSAPGAVAAAQQLAGADRQSSRQDAAQVLLDDDAFRGEASDGAEL